MVRLVDWVAPRGWGDGVAKTAALVMLIIAFNWVVTVLVRDLPFTVRNHVVDTAVVATPFVAAGMAMLRHLLRLQVQLTLLATTDVLTGLPNRRDFVARASLATQGGRAGALLLLDADHFKRINDLWGHAVGDACLTAIAARLRAQLRPGDLVGRLGGEEFAAFLPDATREEAAAVGARLCAAIAVEAEAVEEALAVTLSAGAALGDGVTPLDRLMADADRALYEAKARGRARVVVWPPDEAAAVEAA